MNFFVSNWIEHHNNKGDKIHTLLENYMKTLWVRAYQIVFSSSYILNIDSCKENPWNSLTCGFQNLCVEGKALHCSYSIEL